MKKIRNFSIIAHINHGKSTISDRFIQVCGGLTTREMKSQVLDSMELERERGITIKAQSVTIDYKSLNNKTYHLNFIDTPGHVDFSYEVSRSLSACEGALLVVDSSQGVEAQTLSNCLTALDMNLKIIPVLNKIDLPNSDPDKTATEIEDIIGIPAINAIKCSAKTGFGIIPLLENIVTDIPFPTGSNKSPLQALIIDSWFDNYLGIVSLIRIKNGCITINDKIKLMHSKCIYSVEKLGIFKPKKITKNHLTCGEVGWIVCGIKNILAAPVGATFTLIKNPAIKALPGFKQIKPKIYSGLFPIKSNQYKILRDSLAKLKLNDASLFYEPENSVALGFGFKCGFLGLLHMEIVCARLEREFHINLIATTPTVVYEILKTDNTKIYINTPSKLSLIKNIKEIREPISYCKILTPMKYIGDIINICNKKRGIQIDMIYHPTQVEITYEIPMAEVILNFFDKLKSISSGYASLEYDFKYFKVADMVRLDILVNLKCIDELSSITHRSNVVHRAKEIIKKMETVIPRHQFDIPIQAAIGKRIIIRSTIKQLRKNVIDKCYGGDVSRKKKLLQKQKSGKKRMKKIGNVLIPQEIFLTALTLDINS